MGQGGNAHQAVRVVLVEVGHALVAGGGGEDLVVPLLRGGDHLLIREVDQDDQELLRAGYRRDGPPGGDGGRLLNGGGSGRDTGGIADTERPGGVTGLGSRGRRRLHAPLEQL